MLSKAPPRANASEATIPKKLRGSTLLWSGSCLNWRLGNVMHINEVIIGFSHRKQDPWMSNLNAGSGRALTKRPNKPERKNKTNERGKDRKEKMQGV